MKVSGASTPAGQTEKQLHSEPYLTRLEDREQKQDSSVLKNSSFNFLEGPNPLNTKGEKYSIHHQQHPVPPATTTNNLLIDTRGQHPQQSSLITHNSITKEPPPFTSPGERHSNKASFSYNDASTNNGASSPHFAAVNTTSGTLYAGGIYHASTSSSHGHKERSVKQGVSPVAGYRRSQTQSNALKDVARKQSEKMQNHAAALARFENAILSHGKNQELSRQAVFPASASSMSPPRSMKALLSASPRRKR